MDDTSTFKSIWQCEKGWWCLLDFTHDRSSMFFLFLFSLTIDLSTQGGGHCRHHHGRSIGVHSWKMILRLKQIVGWKDLAWGRPGCLGEVKNHWTFYGNWCGSCAVQGFKLRWTSLYIEVIIYRLVMSLSLKAPSENAAEALTCSHIWMWRGDGSGVYIASPFPSHNYHAAFKHSVPHIQFNKSHHMH